MPYCRTCGETNYGLYLMEDKFNYYFIMLKLQVFINA